MARQRLIAAQLNKMLQDGAVRTAQCASCSIGPVVEMRPDATGCNWKISMINGPHSGECLVALSAFISDLRAQYLLDADDSMDPTLLTTWATR